MRPLVGLQVRRLSVDFRASRMIALVSLDSRPGARQGRAHSRHRTGLTIGGVRALSGRSTVPRWDPISERERTTRG